MVTNIHHTNNSTTTNTNVGVVSSNPFKRLFRLSKDHHHHMNHHHHHSHHDKHDEEKYETCTCHHHLTNEEVIEDNLPSSSIVISSFTMLNSNNNKRRFSLTNPIPSSQTISSTNDKSANEKKQKEKKRKLKKHNKLDIFHFFKGNNTSPTSPSLVGENDSTSNQLIEQNISKLDRKQSIEFNFDFNIVDKPITSNTCYMTNCLTTSSVDYSNNSATFSTNVHNNTTTHETPLDRILRMNQTTKLTSPALSNKNTSAKNEKNQLYREKALKITSNENLFAQPLKSRHSSISNGDKRRRVDENNESMILSDGISLTSSFTVFSDEQLMVMSPKVSQKLDQSFVEEFL